VRLLGVGVSGLADYTQEDLFAQAAGERAVAEGPVEEHAAAPVEEQPVLAERRWPAGHDVRHAAFGHGWVQGSGLGRVTVRFETPDSEPGRVRTLRIDDPELEPADPLPLVLREPEEGHGPGDDSGGVRLRSAAP
jgi:DNA polymerase-4